MVRPDNDPRPFAYVDPPFNFNAASVKAYPPELTGHFLLQSLCRRLGWTSLAGKRLLDFGCGVRFTRTIINLQLDIAEYAGVDVNAAVIEWDRANIKDPRFRFEHVAVRNLMYNPTCATHLEPNALFDRGLAGFDAACMFSVITHQDPGEAEATFKALHPCVAPGGGLYFTALTDGEVADFVERDPAHPGLLSTYRPNFLIAIVERSGWQVESAYAPSTFQQTGFVCRKPAG